MTQFFRVAAWVLAVAPTVVFVVASKDPDAALFWFPAVVFLLVRGLMPGDDNRMFWAAPATSAVLYLALLAAGIAAFGTGRVGPEAAIVAGLMFDALVVSVTGMALDRRRADAEVDADE